MPSSRREQRPRPADCVPRTLTPATTGGVYAGLLTAEEIRALGAADVATLRDEIALLRVLVRRELEAGATTEAIRRLVREIGQAVRVEREVAASENDAIQLALDDLLAEVDATRQSGVVRGVVE